MADQVAKKTQPTTPIEPSRAAERAVRWLAITLGIFALVAGIFRISQYIRDPQVALLISENGAQWICPPGEFSLVTRPAGESQASFRTAVSIDAVPPSAMLTVRAFRLSWVVVNGTEALPPSEILADWKSPRAVDIAPLLRPGENEILINVLNRDGPPALLAHCDAINLRTDSRWQFLLENQWHNVRLASERQQPAIAQQFPPSERALVSSLPVLLPVFVIAALWSMAGNSRWRLPLLSNWQPSPAAVRWAMMIAWVVLAINNISKLPFPIGFDVQGHIEYIMLMMDRGRLPLANDGWQTFQSPLYYLLSLPIVESAFGQMELANIIKLLRIIGLLCGLAQIELCYRAMRLAFPSRPDAQIIGTVVGGLMPMNIYMSQFMGNEPLAAVLMSVAIVIALAFAYGSPRWRSTWAMVLLGAVLGLALLAKVTAILLVPLVVGWIVVYSLIGVHNPRPMVAASPGEGVRVSVIAKRVGVIVGVALLVCGWYYARNWIELGRPFVGGWEARQVTWWQEPGFRTPSEFLRLGTSLRWPAYASVAGLWDSIYSTMWTDGSLSSIVAYDQRPPWNYGFMLSGALLAIVPCALIIIGALAAVIVKSTKRRGAQLLALIAIGVIIAAIADLYMKVPIYSTAKATYSLGFLTCYGILAASGAVWICRHWLIRAIVAGLIAAWAVGAYVAYFIL